MAGRRRIGPPSILSGWKEIANYMGKGVRTVQRYERRMALPVRRPAGRLRGSVVATRAELDAWGIAFPFREGFPQSKRPQAALTPEIGGTMCRLVDLCAQTQRLQRDLGEEIQFLRKSVEKLHIRHSGNRSPELISSVADPDPRLRKASELLTFPMGRRKAS